MPIEDKKTWDEHWSQLENSFFDKLLMSVRYNVIASEVSHTLNKYFPSEGIFVDCGSGTSQTAVKIIKKDRKFIALDISYPILKYAKKNMNIIEYFVNADILKLPFKDSSLQGIWNLGVMEHFTLEEIDQILNEFSRVLKKDGIFIAFWPSRYGPVNILFSILGNLLNKKFFPNEPSLIRSRKWLENIINQNNSFKLIKFKLGLKTVFIYNIIILKKK